MTKTVVRKLRHWKQRFDKNARFIWRRAVKYGGEQMKIGAELPEDFPPIKLKRFWEANIIELAEFEDPNVATGQRAEPAEPTKSKPVELPELPEGVAVERGRGSWLLVTVEGDEKVHKVNGKRALAEFLERLAPKEITLRGSEVLADVYEVEGEEVTQADILILTFHDSGLSPNEWNALPDEDREERLARSLFWMQDQGVEDVPGETAEDDDEHGEADAATVDGATAVSEKPAEAWLS